MRTIFDFKKRARKLGVKGWETIYWRVGCPFRETARAILWIFVFGRNATVSDVLSALMVPLMILALLALPWLTAFGWPGGVGWWFKGAGISIAAGLLIVWLGYGPLDGFGERIHGDPWALMAAKAKRKRKSKD